MYIQSLWHGKWISDKILQTNPNACKKEKETKPPLPIESEVESRERTPTTFESQEESLSHKKTEIEHKNPSDIDMEKLDKPKDGEIESCDKTHEEDNYLQAIIAKLGGLTKKDAKAIIESI